MLLAVDIGNTNITLGVFEGEVLKATWRIYTKIDQMPDEYAMLLLFVYVQEDCTQRTNQ